jgi:hypothetical protein
MPLQHAAIHSVCTRSVGWGCGHSFRLAFTQPLMGKLSFAGPFAEAQLNSPEYITMCHNGALFVSESGIDELGTTTYRIRAVKLIKKVGVCRRGRKGRAFDFIFVFLHFQGLAIHPTRLFGATRCTIITSKMST